jgi:hypothetical protein
MACTLTYTLGGITKNISLPISDSSEVGISTGQKAPNNTAVCWELGGSHVHIWGRRYQYSYGCGNVGTLASTNYLGVPTYSLVVDGVQVLGWYERGSETLRIKPPWEPFGDPNSGNCFSCRANLAECFLEIRLISTGEIIYEDSGECPLENISISCSGCPPNTLDCGDCCLPCDDVFNKLSALRQQVKLLN